MLGSDIPFRLMVPWFGPLLRHLLGAEAIPPQNVKPAFRSLPMEASFPFVHKLSCPGVGEKEEGGTRLGGGLLWLGSVTSSLRGLWLHR